MTEQIDILTEFARFHIPSWPASLTLKRFIQHMTLAHEDLARNIGIRMDERTLLNSHYSLVGTW